MQKLEYKDLLDAGVHFGHLTRKWNPQMAPYIFMEKNGIHIIDLNKTLVALDDAASALQSIVKSGRKVMFVATKKQAKEVVETAAQKLGMALLRRVLLTLFFILCLSYKRIIALERFSLI